MYTLKFLKAFLFEDYTVEKKKILNFQKVWISNEMNY